MEPSSGKHSVKTHFPKDPHFDICLKTKITKSSCIRRAGTVAPRAEHFGDLITADHKVLSEKVSRGTIIDMPWWHKDLARIHPILLQIDRLQLTVVYCNRRCV